MSKQYSIQAYCPGHFHILCPNGNVLYDDAPYGKDKPIIFHDEAKAHECVERLNLEDAIRNSNDH